VGTSGVGHGPEQTVIGQKTGPQVEVGVGLMVVNLLEVVVGVGSVVIGTHLQVAQPHPTGGITVGLVSAGQRTTEQGSQSGQAIAQVAIGRLGSASAWAATTSKRRAM